MSDLIPTHTIQETSVDRAKSRKTRLRYSPLPALLLGAFTLATASSAMAASTLMDELVVTAQKREQNEQDVGIAMAAYSGDQLRALGVEKSFDVARFTPGVHISGNLAGQNTQYSIRGVTQNDFNDIIEAPNAVYLDDGYIAIAQGQTFGVFDIDRVEILKGPQGTLFGRNATGGLIHYISRKPSFDKYEGFLDVTVGRFDSPANANQVRTEAAFGGPVTDKIAARAAIMYNYQEPYLKNKYPAGAVGNPAGPFGVAPGPDAGADLGDDDTVAGRFTVDFQPNEDLRFSFAFNGSRSRLNTGPYQSKPTIGVFDAAGELVNVTDVGLTETRASIAADGSSFGADTNNNGDFTEFFEPTTRPVAGGDFFGYRDPDGTDFTFSSDFAFKDQGFVHTWGVDGKLEWDLSESVTLTSISDFKSFKKLLFIDVDSAPVNQSANYAGVDATTFSQELRLNGDTDMTNWVVGFYYLNIDTDSDNGLKFPVGSIVPGAPFDLGSDARLKTNSYSLFGQIERKLTDQFTFIGGFRVIQENKKYHFEQNIYGTVSSRKIHVGPALLIGPVFGPGGPEPFIDKTKNTLWAGKLQLDWTPMDNLLIYAGVNRGVKAGSFNAQLAGGLPIPTSAIPYKQEVLYSYEGGFKSTFAADRVRLNGTVFYYDYQDYQAFLFTGVSGVVVNADAKTIGVEMELQTNPIEGLDANVSFSYFNATVKDVPLRVGGPIVHDVNPTYAPEFQVSGLVRYEWPMMDGMMSVLGDFSYSDSYFYNLRNFDADKFSSYVILNSRVGWNKNDGHLEMSFSVHNITDERVGIQGFDLATLCGCNEISFQPPRWYGVNLRLTY